MASFAFHTCLLVILVSVASAKKTIKKVTLTTTHCNCTSKNSTIREGVARPFNNFKSFNRRRKGRLRKKQAKNILRQMLKNCPKSGLERTFRGYCNNLKHPTWGSTDTPFLVSAPTVDYQDAKLPNPRVISNIVSKETKSIPNARKMSELIIFFGQLLDHTFTETENGDTRWPITIPESDPVFKNGGVIEFFRTVTAGSGTKRAAINKLSSYVDASSIYGSTEEDSMILRTKSQGKMNLTENDFLVYDGNGTFISGDERANENPNLIAMHTIFTREHNLVCDEILRVFPKLSDERIYQLARKIVSAEFQAITFHEFVPSVLGRKLPRYRGYKSRVPATLSNVFSTVGFRVGHTMINPFITSVDGKGKTKRRRLRDAFFSTKAFREDGMDSLFRGMMNTQTAEVDAFVTPEVRDFLFGTDTTKVVQLDLVALNIQRGRDHGIPRYNHVRKAVGLRPAKHWGKITKNKELQAKLKLAYGSVDNIDAWVGGISEDHIRGGSLGPLFYRIWRREFRRLRDGDRFYFENKWQFTRDEIKKIPTLNGLVGDRKNIGKVMKIIIARNTGIAENSMPADVWFTK